MFALSNFVSAVATVLDIALRLYMWVVIIAAIITWVNPDPYNPVVRFLYGVTEPVLRPIRRHLPIAMGIDFSPLIVILVIIFLRSFLVSSLFELAARMR
ncbi:MAG: YggT family protein [Nitrospirota bacterium]|jgi:YggT family protein